MRWPAIPGLAVLALAWGAPLMRWTGAEFPAHMVQHMAIVAIAAPLLVLGFPELARRLSIGPLAGTVFEFLVVWGWHLPVLYGFAFWRTGGLVLEQGMFLAAGLAVWSGALHARHPLAGAGAMLLTFMHMTLLGALLTLAGRDVYAEICGRAPDIGAQQWGGLVMLIIGTPAYLLAGLWLTRAALHDEKAGTA
jgi:putative membrane protein